MNRIWPKYSHRDRPLSQRPKVIRYDVWRAWRPNESNLISSLILCAICLFGVFFVGCRSPEHDAEALSREPAPARNAGGTVTDIDGNVYRTVTIGTQTWMAENLRVTRDPGGRPITSYCYDDDPAQCATYGHLYTWGVAMNGSTAERAQGIAPDGWHIPTDAEWTELFKHLGGEELAGQELKAGGSTGFDALLGGGADFRGKYLYLGEYGLFWSSTEVSEERAYHHGVDKKGKCDRFAAMKGARIAIRCIKGQAGQ